MEKHILNGRFAVAERILPPSIFNIPNTPTHDPDQPTTFSLRWISRGKETSAACNVDMYERAGGDRLSGKTGGSLARKSRNVFLLVLGKSGDEASQGESVLGVHLLPSEVPILEAHETQDPEMHVTVNSSTGEMEITKPSSRKDVTIAMYLVTMRAMSEAGRVSPGDSFGDFSVTSVDGNVVRLRPTI